MTRVNRAILVAIVGIVLLMVVYMLSGCAYGFKTFMITDKEYTDAVKKYNVYYELAPAETKVEWDKTISPLILKADDALDMWKAALLSGGDAATKQQIFLKLKSEVFLLLLQNKIIELEE